MYHVDNRLDIYASGDAAAFTLSSYATLAKFAEIFQYSEGDFGLDIVWKFDFMPDMFKIVSICSKSLLNNTQSKRFVRVHQ